MPRQLTQPSTYNQEQIFTSLSPPQLISTSPLVQPYSSAPAFGNSSSSQSHTSSTSTNTYGSRAPGSAFSAHSVPSYDSRISPKSSASYSGSPNNIQAASPETTQKPLDYTLTVSGYAPEEIVVSLEGRKVKVHGKHIETRIGGRKTHNEFTKVFDLPTGINGEDIRCYVKDGHTLHLIAHLPDDIQGAVHFIPVNKKY